jgi:hypothetical protein
MRGSIATLLRREGRGDGALRYGYIRPTSTGGQRRRHGHEPDGWLAVFEAAFRADVCNPPVGAHVLPVGDVAATA